MPKRAVFERSRRGLSSNISVGVDILLVVEQSSLERQSRGCAKTPILTVYPGRPGGSVGKPRNLLTLGREFESRCSHTHWEISSQKKKKSSTSGERFIR